MERSAYDLLQSEKSWWYRGRARALAAALSGSRVPVLKNVLDYGAGYGGMRDELSPYGENVCAFEPHSEARAMAEKRRYETVYAREVDAFAQKWDLIGLFDVVEHIDDDRGFFWRVREALNDRGWLAITVPAFPFLWSAHDVNLHHYRRYTKATLKSLLDETDYDVEYASYWNMSLFLPAAAMRLMGKSGESGLSLPGMLDAVFLRLITLETLCQRLISLPFGTGIVVIARKRQAAGIG